ncbi:MAG: hypothetical protein RMJ19_04665 [Gemmatales bacterium]|nr:hypothetical protein [Gemmatales bacterium]MDW8174942.1 hypothetical protein [Gemmatales bacterium]
MPERSDKGPRWLVHWGGCWQELEPLQIITALHEAARRAGERDPFVVQEVAESVWHLLTREGQSRRLWIESELRQQLTHLLRQLGRGSWADKLILSPPGAFAKTPCSHNQDKSTPASLAPIVAGHAAPSFPQEIWRRGYESYAQEVLETLVPEPLAELHRRGVVTLHAIYHPWQLAAAPVIWLPTMRDSQRFSGAGGKALPQNSLWAYWESWRSWIGQAAIVGNMEFDLLLHRLGEVPVLLRELALLSRYLGLSLILHLNRAAPAAPVQRTGALFETEQFWPSADHLATIRQTILETLQDWLNCAPIFLVWHVHGGSQTPEVWSSLRRLWMEADGRVSLVRDEGPVGSQFPEAVLAVVGLSLTQLIAHWEIAEPEAVLQRCRSLMKLVADGLRQWRERLRPTLITQVPPFLLERAQVWMYVTGLETAARHYFDEAERQRSWQQELLRALQQERQQAAQRGAPWCWLSASPPEWLESTRIPWLGSSEACGTTWQLRQPEEWALLQRQTLVLAQAFDFLTIDCSANGFSGMTQEEMHHWLCKVTRRVPWVRLRLRREVTEQPALF